MIRVLVHVALFFAMGAASLSRFLLKRSAAGVIGLQRQSAILEARRQAARPHRRPPANQKRIVFLRVLRDSEARHAAYAGRYARILLARGCRQAATEMAKRALGHWTAARAYTRWASRLQDAA